MGTDRVEPFTIHIADADLRDLGERLARTRWTGAGAGGWRDGTALDYLQSLVEYWRRDYDWRRAESRLNAYPQFLVDCDGVRIHAVHLRASCERALPLLLTHGWPGSFLELLEAGSRLAHPENYGGDAADGFDVVIPSLPGYGFSGYPAQGGVELKAIARLWLTLMSRLGYERFGVQGGDWGAGVSTELGIAAPERVAGVHLNYVMRAHLPSVNDDVDFGPDERAYFEQTDAFAKSEGGYAHLQGTKPQSLAYGLNDSPAGLAGWIVEKFRTWSDCGGDIESVFSRDDVLTNISIYWHTQTIGTSMRLYRERGLAPSSRPATMPAVPFGIASFPKELSRPPRRLVERAFHVERFTEMPRGGHFAAFEQPELFVDDVRAFFTPHR